jgi:hypothetical protein
MILIQGGSMKEIDDIKIEIEEDENFECCMDIEEFVLIIKEEVKKYLPKIKEYAKTHTKDQCINKTGIWWDEALIYTSTEKTLDNYINNVLFPGIC